MQIAARRILAAYKIKRVAPCWPISQGSARLPENWQGWPDDKKFALVIIHDVDTVRGLANCRGLAELDMKMDVRSSFNFVPEDYRVPPWHRHELGENGFEIGVHGLKHDGKIFLSRNGFEKRAPRINQYLKDWNSVGFVSPSMLRNLEWITEFDIEWGCSSFDTDPFEPQSGDMNTIFPILVTPKSGGKAYIELPYTLPQDHCLFVILREKTNRLWKEKLDWVVEKGGVAMVNVHPDYIHLNDGPAGPEQYPAAHYLDLIDYVKNKYPGQFWNPLPRELARFWVGKYGRDVKLKAGIRPVPASRVSTAPTVKIWIDLDNTPHVPFFIPIIKELERLGHKVVLTARNAFQVCELADEKGLKYETVGHHYGKNRIKKIFGLFLRSMQLVSFLRREKPDLALSHGARSQILTSNLFRIPTILITDYEHSRTIPLAKPHWLIVPESLLGRKMVINPEHIMYYRGIKEDVYAPGFTPNPGLMKYLGLQDQDIIVTVRPPADEAHYYNPESTVLFNELMNRLIRTPGVKAVLLPRHAIQEEKCRTNHKEWFADGQTIIPDKAIDGLELLWSSDLVVSGGGTMNREAAALGVPVYSIFRGKIGAVDEMLEKEGRLTLVKSKDEVWTKIKFVRRDKSLFPLAIAKPALEDIINHIQTIIRIQAERHRPQKTAEAQAGKA